MAEDGVVARAATCAPLKAEGATKAWAPAARRATAAIDCGAEQGRWVSEVSARRPRGPARHYHYHYYLRCCNNTRIHASLGWAACTPSLAPACVAEHRR